MRQDANWEYGFGKGESVAFRLSSLPLVGGSRYSRSLHKEESQDEREGRGKRSFVGGTGVLPYRNWL